MQASILQDLGVAQLQNPPQVSQSWQATGHLQHNSQPLVEPQLK
jgi:hypothetical protein